jgi:ornithine cyclodeaminase
VRKFTRILVCGTDAAKVRDLVNQMPAELQVEEADAKTCVASSDVICTCTTSPTPLFDGNLIKPGTHLNVVGAFQPRTREVDDVTVQRSRVVVDTYTAALDEAGDILIPLNKGLITREHIWADLHELLSGKKAVRTNAEEVTLFKSVGIAIEDLATAELIQVDS